MRPKARRAATPEVAPVAPEPPLAPLARDPWAWIAVSVVALLVVRSLGAPFGEPVADDFDHLHHVLFATDRSWLDGGGSVSFWRPLAYQGYYGLLSGVILAHPAWIGVLHAALAALAVLLVHDTVRRRLPAPAAATAAVFPWLVESSRALLTVPVHFVDLGLIVFSVLAWRAAAVGRLAFSLAALLAALLCKETAVATAAVLPWLVPAGRGPGRRAWIAGVALVVVAWAATYASVRAREALALPHGLEAGLAPALVLEGKRWAWAAAGTARALLSLPMRAAAHEAAVFAAALLVLAAAAVTLAASREARARFARARTLALAGLAWSALASATLLTVFPVWSPERVVFAALGLGVALAALLSAAHPALPWLLLALRLATFLGAPSAPARVVASAPEAGAFVDFEKLARLQRLMVEARTALRADHPSLPHGARVALLHPPLLADYAMGDRALQVWYRDSTVRWLRWEQLPATQARGLAGAIEFAEHATPQFRRVETEALRLLFVAESLDRARNYRAQVDTLALADALQRDRAAHHVLGRIQGFRALGLWMLGREAQAESLARASLIIAPENMDGHFALAMLHGGRGEWATALAHLDAVEAMHPGLPTTAGLRRILERARRGIPAPAP